MKRSTHRILTTHVGSLPRPPELIPALVARDSGQPYDEEDLARRVGESVRAVVRKQVELRGLSLLAVGWVRADGPAARLAGGDPGRARLSRRLRRAAGHVRGAA